MLVSRSFQVGNIQEVNDDVVIVNQWYSEDEFEVLMTVIIVQAAYTTALYEAPGLCYDRYGGLYVSKESLYSVQTGDYLVQITDGRITGLRSQFIYNTVCDQELTATKLNQRLYVKAKFRHCTYSMTVFRICKAQSEWFILKMKNSANLYR